MAAVVSSSVAPMYFPSRRGDIGRYRWNERVLHSGRAVERAQHHRDIEIALDPKSALAFLSAHRHIEDVA